MKTVRWNPDKAKAIKETRGIDFDKLALLIEEGELLGTIKVPSRENQKMFLVNYDDYLVCVPFVEDSQEIFLKTAYKNRKLNKLLAPHIGDNHDNKTPSKKNKRPKNQN